MLFASSMEVNEPQDLWGLQFVHHEPCSREAWGASVLLGGLIAIRYFAVSTLLQRYENVADCVSAIAKPLSRRAESVKPAALKSP